MIDITRRKIGINFIGGKAEVKVWAPLLQSVWLLTNKNRIRLTKDELGYWTAATDQIRPGDRYKFQLEQDKEFPDPASLLQPDTVHGPSEAVALNDYPWSDALWKNHPLQDYIIYELHTGTFTADGTFASIEEKLDYLCELGITAIEIMPIAQFPGNRNWGYDGVFPFAVQNSYGGARGLQHLVDTCHAKGLAVILDVVYNHMGPEGNYLGAYGPYFTNKYNTPWGNALNFDDAYCYGVRNFFIENVLMWFRDFHIDALRLDAVHAIKDFSALHILKEIREYVDQLKNFTQKDHWLIVESDLNDPRFIDKDEKGFGMHAQWVDEFHHALRVTAGGENTGYYSDFSGIEHLAKAYKDAYVYDGQYSPHRNKFFGRKAENHPGEQFIVFSQNHDQVGNRMLGERTSTLLSFEMQKLLAGAVMISPYLPMLFMGEEWSEPNPFLYFVSHTDPELAEAVRKGRKEEFAAFHVEGEAPDPMAEETFQRSKLQWQLLNKELHAIMLRYYRQLIHLRKQQTALRQLNRKNLQVHADPSKKVLVLKRWNEDQELIALLNFSRQEQLVEVSNSNAWMKLLDSSDAQWLGSREAPETLNEAGLSLAPESITIYTNLVSHKHD